MADTPESPGAPPRARQRLARDERFRQLIDVAWALARHEGMDALTLGRLAERAGVTKPVVYDHFGTRNGLLAALYLEFEARQAGAMDAAIAASRPVLADRAAVLSAAYVECVLAEGRELPGVVGAMTGVPELELVRRECQAGFLDKCRLALAPFAPGGQLSSPRLRAVVGAADALSYAAVAGEITPQQAKAELASVIAQLVAGPRP